MEISPGAIIAGRYRADYKIGAGSMGEVWGGENIAVGYKVAIKTMLEEGSDDPEVVARFKREAFILGRIRSDYVARVLDFASDETYGLVLVLDLIEGEPFSTTLRRTQLTVEEAIEIGFDVVSGLVDLHRFNIVHRDLKPSNIILEPHGEGRRAIIVDFGVSRLIKTSEDDEEITNITRADMALGTLEYMAPEQMLDSRNVTGSSDVYAVGAMLYRAVAGQHAFGDLQDVDLARMKLLTETPPLVTGRSDKMAKRFEAVVGRALRRRPADRYKLAAEMLKDLGQLRERLRQGTGASRRSLPSLVEDEPTVNLDTSALEVEKSPSLKVEPPAETKPALTSDSASGSASAAVPAAASPALPAPPPAFTIDSTPPPRPGVSTGVFVAGLFAALIGGVALGATMLTPPPPDTTASAQPSTAETTAGPTTAAPTVAAPTASSVALALDGGALDASRPDAADAAADAAADGAAPGNAPAIAPSDAGKPLVLPSAIPPPPLPRPGGGPLPGAPY